MKNFRFLSVIFAGLALACSLFSGVYAHALKPVVEVTASWLKKHALQAFKLAACSVEAYPRALVLLVQAKAFVLRLAKRERPQVTSQWRMCPST